MNKICALSVIFAINLCSKSYIMVDQCLFLYEINLLFSKNKYLCFLFYSTIISKRIEQTDWIVVEYSDTLISNEGRYHYQDFSLTEHSKPSMIDYERLTRCGLSMVMVSPTPWRSLRTTMRRWLPRLSYYGNTKVDWSLGWGSSRTTTNSWRPSSRGSGTSWTRWEPLRTLPSPQANALVRSQCLNICWSIGKS